MANLKGRDGAEEVVGAAVAPMANNVAVRAAEKSILKD